MRKEPLQGPYAKRHTTDCVWLIIFFAFMLGMVRIAAFLCLDIDSPPPKVLLFLGSCDARLLVPALS